MGIWINITLISFVAAYPLKALDTNFELNFNNSLESYAIRVLLDFASKVSKPVPRPKKIRSPPFMCQSRVYWQESIVKNLKIQKWKKLRALFTLKILSHCSEPMRVDQFGRWLCSLQSAIKISMTQNLQCEKSS